MNASFESDAYRTELALERTLGAANRTFAATLRTATSLVALGLTLFQIFSSGLKLETPVIEGWARVGGAMLVLTGEGVLIAALVQHERFLRDLAQRHERLHAQGLLGAPPDLPHPPTRVLALAVVVGGLAGLLVLAMLSVARP